MTPESVMTIGQSAMKVLLSLAAPPLLAALFTGLFISLLQAATQVNEQTLAFIPKILAVVLILLFTGPWMLSLLIDYLRLMLTQLPQFTG